VIAVSAIEHDAVYKTASAAVSMRDEGRLVILPVSAKGVVEVPDESAIPDCALISVMTANNETGTIQPVGEWAAAAARRGALFHTDAVQAAGHIPVDVRRTGADLLSLSAHKLHGPAGIGALYIRKEIARDFPPLCCGGGQERGKRPGTVPAALIAAFGAAAEEARCLMEWESIRCASLRDRIEKELLKIPGSVRNGEGERLPGVCSISFRGIGGEAAALLCGLNGVMLSSGSACHAGSEEPSRVLLAMTGDTERASSALRISVGRGFGEEDAEAVIRTVTDVVRRIREA
jgi:cysteine desulfurase